MFNSFLIKSFMDLMIKSMAIENCTLDLKMGMATEIQIITSNKLFT